MKSLTNNISITALLCILVLSACTKKPEGTITVTTKSVTDITESSAKTGGSVTSFGYSVGDCGVCYGESHNPTLNNSFTKDHEGDGSFSSILSNLKSGTQYYVRAYAKTSSGIEYGKEVSFTTQGGYTINVFANPTASGTVTGAGSYQPEESCTVTATANTGYTFTNWTENGTIFSSNESYNFTVAGSRNLTANFSLKSYSIAVSVAPDNSGTVSGGGEYNHGQSCTLRATANSGFSFTNWTENGEVVSTNANYTFTVDGNRTFVANFEVRNYTISVSTDPSVGGVVSGGGSNFQYSQSCTVTATANSGYAFTNWTENGNVVSTNSNYTFTVTNDRTLVANFEGAYNGHGYVDLGLPSGTLWATCNVGATTPESNGDKFAWGEVQPKSSYEWSNYRYCHGGDGVHTLTKYCNDSEYGYNGFTDNLTILLPSDDAATVNWGTGWSTPGSNQWYELFQNTTMDWTSQNGVYGLLLTASNGKTLFFPQSGYWMNCLTTYAPPPAAILFSINYNDFIDHLTDRCYGLYVRPVHQN